MVRLTIEIKGMDRLNNALRNLSPELKKGINKGSMQFLKAVRKSAKLRAPRSSGELANSIMIKQGDKENVLAATAPHAARMETGKGLPAWFRFPRYSTRTRGQYMVASGSAGPSPGPGFKRVKRFKPFMFPAFEANIAKLGSILFDRSTKAMKRAGFN